MTDGYMLQVILVATKIIVMWKEAVNVFALL